MMSRQVFALLGESPARGSCALLCTPWRCEVLARLVAWLAVLLYLTIGTCFRRPPLSNCIWFHGSLSRPSALLSVVGSFLARRPGCSGLGSCGGPRLGFHDPFMCALLWRCAIIARFCLACRSERWGLTIIVRNATKMLHLYIYIYIYTRVNPSISMLGAFWNIVKRSRFQ